MVKVEVGREQMDLMVGHGLVMDERHEVQPDGEWIRAVRRWTGRDNLFLYWHRETHKFVLAAWLVAPGEATLRVCRELEVLDTAPDRGGWLGQEWCRTAFRDPEEIAREVRGRIREAKWQKAEASRATQEERDSTARHLVRQGKDEVASKLYESPYVGTIEGGESLQKMKEDLGRLTSGRSIHAL